LYALLIPLSWFLMNLVYLLICTNFYGGGRDSDTTRAC